MPATLTTKCIFATVSAGGITVSTPYIKSFNVNRSRGAVGTASASLKVKAVSGGSGAFTINTQAGRIFTGTVRKFTISPCFEDPSYVIVNVEGVDAMDSLSGKKFTRRCRSTTSAWASIDGISRKGLKDSKFAYRQQDEFDTSGGELNENAPVVRNRSFNAFDMSDLPKVSRTYTRRDVQLQYSFEGGEQ